MLAYLSAHNYTIIEYLDLELATDMSVTTGETDVDKLAILDALGLALDDRVDSDAVRPGVDRVGILVSFDVGATAEARD